MIRKTFYTYFVLALFLPVATGAQGIVSETTSESDTGGNTVGSGGITTSGDSSASVHTTVQDGSSGSSTVEIKIETKVDGEVYTETIKKEVKDGGKVRVSTSSTSKGKTSKEKAEVKAGASVIVGKTIQSNIASSTFWSRIPLFKSFAPFSTTTGAEISDKTFVRIHATSSPVDGLKSFIQRIFSILIFWR